MGEKAKSIGEKLEGFGQDLFKGFGWKELARDRELKCHKSAHKKKTHGIDLLHSCLEPYRDQRVGIITECKNRQWKNINSSMLSNWIMELEYTIDCTQNSGELNDVDFDGTVLNTGILLVHTNDGMYNEQDFYKYLSSIPLKTRRNPINIFVAGNDRIDMWNALLSKVKGYKEDFKYVYPSINGSKYAVEDYLTVNHLFSRFVFGQREYYEEHNDGTTIKNSQLARRQNIVFSFDTCETNSFKYLCSLFKHFQFESGHQYVFCFYPKSAEDIEFTKRNFLRAVKDEGGKGLLDEKKIIVDFLTNRHISPVDYKG